MTASRNTKPRGPARNDKDNPSVLDQRAVRFLKSLKRHNTREWFDAHREDYECNLKLPAKRFAEDLRPLLAPRFPWLEVSGKSLFRINRDTRFSNDKSPYKTWIGYWFFDRRFDKNAAPGLYLGLDPTGLALGGGIWRFEPIQRAIYRERITQSPSEMSFSNALVPLERAGFEMKGRELKKIPAGYDPDHSHAEYLLYNGLYAAREIDFPKSFGTTRFASEIAKLLSPCKDLLDWLATQLPRNSS